MQNSEIIGVDEARKMAEASALEALNDFILPDELPALRAEFCEQEHCYVFFHNEKIMARVPRNVLHAGQWVYVIIKKRGHTRFNRPVQMYFMQDYGWDEDVMAFRFKQMSDALGQNKM